MLHYCYIKQNTNYNCSWIDKQEKQKFCKKKLEYTERHILKFRVRRNRSKLILKDRFQVNNSFHQSSYSKKNNLKYEMSTTETLMYFVYTVVCFFSYFDILFRVLYAFWSQYTRRRIKLRYEHSSRQQVMAFNDGSMVA